MYKLENNIQWTTGLKNAFKHGVTRASILYTDENEETIDLNENNNLIDLTLDDNRYIEGLGFIGSACAKKLDITIHDATNSLNLENKDLTLKIGAEYNGSTYYINYGNFIVNEAPQIDETNGKMTITAYDYMIKFNQPYEDRVTYPTTLLLLTQDVCSQAGVTLATENFINYDFVVTDNQFAGMTLREVIQNVAKCAFSWARIGQDNKLYFDFSQTADNTETLTIDDYKTNGFKKAKEYYGPVNQVTYADSDIEGQEDRVRDTESIETDGLKELVIYDNLFGYTSEKRQALIQGGTSLFGLTYMPVSKLDSIGFIYLDNNDIINIETLDNQTYTTRVFNHNIKYTGVTSDTIITEGTSNNEETYRNTATSILQNQQTRIIVDKANKKINAVVEQTSDNQSRIALLEADVNGLYSRVVNIENFSATASGRGQVFIQNTSDLDGSIIRLKITGETELLQLSSTTYLSENTYLRGQYLTLIVDKFPPGHLSNEHKELIIPMPFTLKKLDDNIYDEINLYDSDLHIIKRVGLDSQGNKYELAEPEITVIKNVLIPSRKDYLYLYILENANLYFELEYLNDSDYIKYFASKVELSSSIEQTSEAITLEVRKKVGEDEIISKINQTAEQITIDANKLNINGVVSANGNFEIDTEGNVSLAGNIYMTGTNTRIVGGDGLMTNLQYYTSGDVGIDYLSNGSTRRGIACLVNIPSNFTIRSATLTVKHSTLQGYEYSSGGTTTHYGNSQNVSCTKTSYLTYERTGANVDITVPIVPSTQGTVVTQLGNFSGNQTKTADITNSLSSGLQYLILADYVDSVSSYGAGLDITGHIGMYVDVTGYMTI